MSKTLRLYSGKKFRTINPSEADVIDLKQKNDDINLGICVVYLTNEDDLPLLKIHLNYINKNTESPYTIYGAANRLNNDHIIILEQNPNVKIIEVKTTELRDTPEVGYYLEHLIDAAIKDGVSHVAIFHIDSFPIKKGWDLEIINLLSDKCLLASENTNAKSNCKPGSVFMLFNREFYVKYKPKLLLSAEEQSSDQYLRYEKIIPHVKDVGFGYGYKLFAENLSWLAIPVSNNDRKSGHPHLNVVYGDLIYHMGSVIRSHKKFNTRKPSKLHKGTIPKLMVILPKKIKNILKPYLYKHFWVSTKAEDVLDIKMQLYNNSDGYIEQLRSSSN